MDMRTEIDRLNKKTKLVTGEFHVTKTIEKTGIKK